MLIRKDKTASNPLDNFIPLGIRLGRATHAEDEIPNTTSQPNKLNFDICSAMDGILLPLAIHEESG